MNTRQETVLRHIIEDYTRSAQPVSSASLASNRDLAISPATIRNDMAKLEQEGLIFQPHTSAGRVPTMSGVDYYISNLLKAKTPSAKESVRLNKIFSADGLRGLARESAALTQSAAIIVCNEQDFYYTGFSYLFSQPEFIQAHFVRAVSEAVDRIEETIDHFLSKTSAEGPTIFIGNRNPLGKSCSAIFISSKDKSTIFGLLAPVRTNYPRNVGILSTVKQFI